MKKGLTFVVLISFLLYSLFGCSSEPSTKHLDKYDDRVYADLATYQSSRESVYRAAVFGLQQKGYVITLSDPQTGLISGEVQSAQPLAEEFKAAKMSEEPSSGNILITILGIVFLFGIIAWLASSSDSNNDKEKEKRSRNEPHYHDSPTETKTLSYKYVVSLTLATVDSASTKMRISAVRTSFENGGVTSSGLVENKYLNYSIFEAIQHQLETAK
jgi:hypothetical protein